jgi:hypothetical protein
MNTLLDAQRMEEPSADEAPRYRSVSRPAILSLAIGVFSILTIFHPVFAVVPLVAIVLGWYALSCIRAVPDEYTGTAFAWGGMVAAIVLGVSGFSVYRYVQSNSRPAGYEPISFDDLQPTSDREIIPARAYDLEPTDQERDKRIYITGFIYPGQRTQKLKEFILVPKMSHCNFCQSALRSTEMILVKFTGDLKTDYTYNLVKLGGKFHIDREQVANPFGGLPYQLQADFFQE